MAPEPCQSTNRRVLSFFPTFPYAKFPTVYTHETETRHIEGITKTSKVLGDSKRRLRHHCLASVTLMIISFVGIRSYIFVRTRLQRSHPFNDCRDVTRCLFFITHLYLFKCAGSDNLVSNPVNPTYNPAGAENTSLSTEPPNSYFCYLRNQLKLYTHEPLRFR